MRHDVSRHVGPKLSFVAVPVNPDHGLRGLRKAWADAKEVSGLTAAQLGNMRLANARGAVWLAVWSWRA